ncbi:MAG: MoaD/ThiS family protein [Planctomycetota bacterium]
MKVEVLLFASLRDLAQSDRISVELAEDATVADLLISISTQYPLLEDRVALSRVAVNDRFSRSEDPIPSGSELALIPPVSGG